jgi:hypothetical protein
MLTLQEEMISAPQRTDVVLELTVKDENGQPLKASVRNYYFIPSGWEGGYGKQVHEITGFGRFELGSYSS